MLVYQRRLQLHLERYLIVLSILGVCIYLAHVLYDFRLLCVDLARTVNWRGRKRSLEIRELAENICETIV